MDERRRHVHAMWASVADRWDEHADYAEARAGLLNDALLEGGCLGPTDAVLELACGPGGLGIAAAALAQHVTLTDVVPAMVDIAAKRAANAGCPNVATAVRDLEAIAEPDAAYDVVLCREGLMFAVDPAAALGEIRRVLRPSGRLALSVWAAPAENPWLSVVLDAVAAQVGHPVPPPGMPGPFALSDDAALCAQLQAAGFVDVTVRQVPVPLRAASFEAWWARTTAVAGPVAKVIASLPDIAQAELAERARSGAAAFTAGSGAVEFPGLAHVITCNVGRRDKDTTP